VLAVRHKHQETHKAILAQILFLVQLLQQVAVVAVLG
jgi:hypothetical protein